MNENSESAENADTWDSIADWYVDLVRSGSALNDFNRDILLDQLPADLTGRQVLDLGCGEGIITRAVAARGAAVLGIDPSPRMIGHARSGGGVEPGSAAYAVDDACVLATVADDSMDWVTAGLALNNVSDLDATLLAVRRVLRPAGSLVLTVPHPCFEAPHASWSQAADGTARRVVGDYLAEGFWRSTNPEAVRRAGNHHRSLTGYLRALLRHGFALEYAAEPSPTAAVAAQQPQRAGLPPFLVLRAAAAGSVESK
ncbi:ubiquinone/menaquinone biosynthesis C-methylase UbiE [Kitasatospora sp. GP30]|uniref:class I SAM-dependent methyltransferase n=1 Tax=Kitasatospora sp. GP30 TaxID=3035084 RepID=UPI000CB6F567|nr:methyltransferase domain-containing protein [Kitasatospora sp. GP30]MDH6142104.1 ubiquinone/menaquinone biosynthesis C-methylase UbiE [Kitasatospora sp. GP30]